MSKRLLASFLWFAVTWFGYELAWSLTQVPRMAGPVVAFAVGAFIALDPFGVFWLHRDDSNASPASRNAPRAVEIPAR